MQSKLAIGFDRKPGGSEKSGAPSGALELPRDSPGDKLALTSDGFLDRRLFRIDGNPTTIALEPAFWHMLLLIAGEEHMKLADLIEQIDAMRPKDHPRTSAVRVFIAKYYAEKLRETRDKNVSPTFVQPEPRGSANVINW